MLFTDKELAGFRKMFRDANILTQGTDDSMYWLALRDRLAKEIALGYLTNRNPKDHILQAVQLRELGAPDGDWNSVADYLALLREGVKLELKPGWEGHWCWVLQTIFGCDWDKQDVIFAQFFTNRHRSGV